MKKQPKTVCGIPNLSRTDHDHTLASGDCVALNLRQFTFHLQQSGVRFAGGLTFKVHLQEVGPLPVPKTLRETIDAIILLDAERPAHGEADHPGEKNFQAFLKQLHTETIRYLCVLWDIGFEPVENGGWDDHLKRFQGDRARLIEFLTRHTLGESLKEGLAYTRKMKCKLPELNSGA